ncbi:MAG: thiazole biosynthesis adenylyltransferase ThiF [Bryobacterales bacterium]|nr:thiazole biosynthesis adenylyltransferase ThiF [Bryobacterales bacterium]
MRPPESRYSRQIRFAPLGEQGQANIRAARVAIVGCGALGTVQAEAMARAGVGRLRLIDRDFVEWSNLQRQFLFDEADAAEALPKAVAAARRLAKVNSEVEIEPMVADLTPASAPDLFEDIDLILDGTDNFETRFLINDAAVSAGIPWIYGAAVGSYGIKLPIVPGMTACLRCVYPEPPRGAQPTCETEGVLAAVTATIAALQAGDALKMLALGTDSVVARLTTVDVWTGAIRQLAPPPRDPDCPCCVRREFVHLNGSRRAPISLCGRNAVQIHERSRPVDLPELAQRLSAVAPVRSNEFALRVVIDPYELTVFADGRAIIKGTQDAGVARSLYARYIGA